MHVLNDGSIMIQYVNNTPTFLIDVNGKKGPNKVGHDLFRFLIASTSGGYRLVGSTQSDNDRLTTCFEDSDDMLFKTFDDLK